MVSVTTGENLFKEAVEKVFRTEGLVFERPRLWTHDYIILDTRDVKTHTCGLIWKSETKVTRIIAQFNHRLRSITIYRREDLEFVKRLAENISSASATPVSYDLHELPSDLVAYKGCCDWHGLIVCVSTKSLS